jgi:hypothetical protein
MGLGSSVVMVVIEDVVGKAHDVVAMVIGGVGAMVIDDVVVTVHDDVGMESGTENTLLGVGGVKVCTVV